MKMLMRLVNLLLLLSLLAGCAQAAPAPTETAAPQTALPEPTLTEPAAPETVLPGKPPPTAAYPASYPAADSTPPEPYPADPGTPAALAAPLGEPIPFSDCARAPALAGCAQGVLAPPPLAGLLSFAESAPPRVVGLDLASGQGWQAALQGEPAWLDWSPDGQLLAAEQTGQGEQYALFGADGAPLERFRADLPPAWQPDGSLGRDGRLRSAAGWEAELAQTPDFQQELRFRPPGGEWRALPLQGESPDAFFSLRGWQPGAERLLAQSYLPGNAALLFGGDLLLIDLQTETITPLVVTASLEAGSYAWNPAQPALLAFAASPPPDGTRRLALYDADTGQLRYPLPDGVQVEGLAWQPGGDRLAFAVGELSDSAAPAARAAFPGPGIYLLSAQTGAVEALPAPPPGAQDGWPHWADDDILVYGRALPAQGGGRAVQVRARSLSTGQDWLLLEGLPAPPSAAGRIFWNRALAFEPQQ